MYYVNLINLKSFQIIALLTFIFIAVSETITLNNMKLPIFDNLGPIRMTILCDSLYSNCLLKLTHFNESLALYPQQK